MCGQGSEQEATYVDLLVEAFARVDED